MSYVELHCHSNYSFQEGASSIDEMVSRAVEFGYPALALTDHDNLCGAMEFAQWAGRLGVRPITGVEVTLRGASARSRSEAQAHSSTQSEPNSSPGHMTLLASLELSRRRELFLRQVAPFTELWLYRRGQNDEELPVPDGAKEVQPVPVTGTPASVEETS